MNSPLNPLLYERLSEEFGFVRIHNPGVANSKRYDSGMFLSRQATRMALNSAGETYSTLCPYCGDSRGRLWINYSWGVVDEVTGDKCLWLAICFNEDCLADRGRPEELYERIYGFRNIGQRVAPVVILPGIVEEQVLKEASLPGKVIPLTDLPQTDKAILYLRERGLDPQAIQSSFDVSYCLEAFPQYKMAEGRIVIPIKMNGILVGWQCRLAENSDYKSGKVLKYYSMPGMPRRLMLYNYDNAIKFPFVVVVEGPISAWNVGPYAVAAFGKHVSNQQIKLLCDWKVIVIMLDGDANKEAIELENRLILAGYRGRIVKCLLEDGKDPHDMSNSQIADLIVSSAQREGIDILNLERKDNDNRFIEQRTNAGLSSAITRLRYQLESTE